MAGQVSCQLQGLQIPYLEGRILGSGYKQAGVGGEGAQVHGRDVAPQRSEEGAISISRSE